MLNYKLNIMVNNFLQTFFQENSGLKERLNELESHLTSNKNYSTFQSPNIKKTSVLLGIILILSVNLGSIR